MKMISLLMSLSLILPYCLFSQSMVNSGTVITIKSGSAVKITGDYINQQEGRIKNAGILNLNGNWIQNSTDLIFLPATGGLVKITGPTSHMVGGSNASVFHALKIETEVSVNEVTGISQNLDLSSGMLNLTDHDLILFGGSTITGASQNHFINTNGNGILNRVVDGAPVLFPVGRGMNYSPVTITNNAGSDEFAVRVFDNVLENGLNGGQLSNIEETVKHSWVILDGNDIGGTIDYDVQIEWQGVMEGTAFDRSHCAINYHDGTSWQMGVVTSALGSDPYSLVKSNSNIYGVFTVQSEEINVPAVYFVTQTGAGIMDGSSWANASPSIQDMIDIANDEDEIWVASGTYYPEEYTINNISDRYMSFIMVSGVTIRGGFAGNEDPETFDLDQRDFVTNETILSGDIGTPGDNSDNCFHVVYCPNVSMVGFDGLTIQDGYGANYMTDVFAWDGAGIYANYSIINCDNLIFKNNSTRRSGAVYLTQNADLTISNSSFEDNGALNGGSGGAIHGYSSDIIIELCQFSDNYASVHGGAVYVNNGELSISNSDFIGNDADGSGGGVHVTGYYYLNISNCGFLNNVCYTSGAGISCGSYSGTPVTGIIEDCTFSGNNSTLNGGAAAFSHSFVEMNRCVVTNNTCGTGTINYNGNGYFKLSNTKITNNNTTNAGGGMAVAGEGDIIVSNCVIAENTATYYGGGLSLNALASPKFFNSILWDNTAINGVEVYINADNCEPEFYYCDIKGGKAAFEGGGAGSSYAFDFTNANNIDLDPLFVNAAGSDFTLEAPSPCNNSGTPPGTAGSPLPYTEASGNDWILYYDGGQFLLGSIDLSFNPRLYGSAVDMGAYELQQDLLQITLDIKVFLEGPYEGPGMSTSLNSQNQLPLDQPYNTSPWNYSGSEMLTSIPNTAVVDWLLLELRDATDASSATSASVIRQQPVFLLNDGNITTIDGSSYPQINNVAIQNMLYLVVCHRNHLAVLSADPLIESNGVYAYDFTTGSTAAHNGGQKEIATGVWGMVAADGSADGAVGNEDYDPLWKSQAASAGYLPSDYNLDAQVDNKDKNDLWLPNLGKWSTVPQ